MSQWEGGGGRGREEVWPGAQHTPVLHLCTLFMYSVHVHVYMYTYMYMYMYMYIKVHFPKLLRLL